MNAFTVEEKIKSLDFFFSAIIVDVFLNQAYCSDINDAIVIIGGSIKQAVHDFSLYLILAIIESDGSDGIE